MLHDDAGNDTAFFIQQIKRPPGDFLCIFTCFGLNSGLHATPGHKLLRRNYGKNLHSTARFCCTARGKSQRDFRLLCLINHDKICPHEPVPLPVES